MDSGLEMLNICRLCGGIKPNKNKGTDTACECTCNTCSDGKEYD